MGLATVIIKGGQIPPPTCPSWFHLGLLHTILDERLGIKRNAMKHLTLTAVSLLLIGLTMSSTAYSQVPVWEREALTAFYNATDGDELVVTRVDRLARSIRDLQNIVYDLDKRGVTLSATEQPIDPRRAWENVF